MDELEGAFLDDAFLDDPFLDDLLFGSDGGIGNLMADLNCWILDGGNFFGSVFGNLFGSFFGALGGSLGGNFGGAMDANTLASSASSAELDLRCFILAWDALDVGLSSAPIECVWEWRGSGLAW